MNEYVVDASALAYALIGSGEGAAALRSRLAVADCHAPHLIDAELGNVLRKRMRAGDITDGHARTILAAAPDVTDYRYPHAGRLSQLAWSWRDNMSFYDALYVALAVQLDVTLMTGDRRLSRSPGIGCRIELV